VRGCICIRRRANGRSGARWGAWPVNEQVRECTDAVSPIRLRLGLNREFPFPKGVNMSAATVRILVVGNSTANTESILRELARSGWESHAVKTVCEAEAVLRTIRYQLTLATEKLPDGTGYDLAALIAQQSGNLFISVPLSETCLWLPVVEHGVRSLGQRALNPLTLATEAEFILRTADATLARAGREVGGDHSSVSDGIRGEVVPARTVAQLAATERFGRQVRERYEHGDDAEKRGPIAPRRPVVRGAPMARENPVALTREGSAREEAALGKRWRGF